jgi:hypothetical protein
MHYAKCAFTLDRSHDYRQAEPTSFGKPRGFWVSVAGESDWPSFCRSEDFGIDRLAVEHTVTLSPDSNVLRIDDAVGMREFHDRFAVVTDFERRHPSLASHQRLPIDWRAVAQVCDGIIIAPYQWSQRLDMSWYYGWDCASGCIWNLSAIAAVTVALEAAS